MTWNITNFFENVSDIARANRGFIHNVTENIPVAREFAIPFEDVLQGVEVGAAEAAKVTGIVQKAEKLPQLEKKDIVDSTSIFGFDVPVPKSELEILYNLGRRDASEYTQRIDSWGKQADHATGLIVHS